MSPTFRFRSLALSFVLVCGATPLAAQMLHDNGPLTTGSGNGGGGANTSAVQTALGQTVTGYAASTAGATRVADDFVVPIGGWLLSGVTLFGFQTGADAASPAIDAARVRLWQGVPDAPGSVVLFDSGGVTPTVASAGIFRVIGQRVNATRRPIERIDVAATRVLRAGSYWLDWELGGDEASGPYVPPVTRPGQTSAGNARQWRGGAWQAIPGTGSGESLPFVLRGGPLPNEVFADGFED